LPKCTLPNVAIVRNKMRLSLEALQESGNRDMVSKLSQEFKQLNGEIFNDNLFVEYEENPKQTRHNDLSRFFRCGHTIEI
jgi:hypothetical protein